MKQSLPLAIKVVKVIKENHNTRTYITDLCLPKAKPGQFVMLWLPNVNEKPFSLADNNPVTVTVRTVGEFTKIFNSTVKKGDIIWYRGPLGNGVFENTKRAKVIVGGGYGTVPLYFLAKNYKMNDKTTVILGARNKDELLFEEKFRKLGCKIRISTDDGSKGKKGLVTDILKEKIKEQKISMIYACGPVPMLKSVAELCDKNNIRYQISLESIIKCGMGLCGSCAVGSKLICKDGPVFTAWPE